MWHNKMICCRLYVLFFVVLLIIPAFSSVGSQIEYNNLIPEEFEVNCRNGTRVSMNLFSEGESGLREITRGNHRIDIPDRIDTNTSPVADFSFNPTHPTIQEVVTCADQSIETDGEIINWEWDFGDGLLSNGTGALSFDGVDNIVDCGVDESLGTAGALTMSAWIKPGFSDDHQAIITDKWTKWWLALQPGTKTVVFIVRDTNSSQHWGGSYDLPSYDRWYHIAGVVDENTGMYLYVNGINVRRNIGSFSIRKDTGRINIGGNGYGGSNDNFNGSIDDVCLYDRALNNTEIQQIYFENVPVNHLVSWWQFDEGNETSIYDALERNNGTLDGEANWIHISRHRYVTPGEYNITLTVRDNDNLTDSITDHIRVFEFDLLNDPGFEIPGYGDDEFKYWSETTGSEIITYDNETYYSGMASCRIERTSLQGWSTVSQWIDGVEPFTTYELSAYVKTETMNGNGGFLWVAFTDLPEPEAVYVSGDTDWIHRRLVFTTGSSTGFGIHFGLGGKSNGTIWFDDVTLRKTSIQNPGFELLGSGGLDTFKYWDEHPGPGTITADTTTNLSGEFSCKIEKQEPNGISFVSQLIQDIQPCTTYELNIYIKMREITSQGAYLQVNFLHGSSPELRLLSGNTTWLHRKLVFSTGLNTNFSLTLGVPDTCTGTIWLDSLSLKQTNIQNSEFELLGSGDLDTFKYWDEHPGPGTITADTTINLSDRYSCKIEKQDPNDESVITQAINRVQSNTTYELGVYIKTDDIEGSGVFLSVVSEETGILGSLPLERSPEWGYQSFVFSSKHATNLELQLGVADGTAGTVWFDGVLFKQTRRWSYKDLGTLLVSNDDYSIGTAPTTLKIFQSDEVPLSIDDHILVDVARGEYEPFQLIVTPNHDLSITSLEHTFDGLSDLNLEIHLVDYVHVNQSSDDFGFSDLWPDPLPPFEVFMDRYPNDYFKAHANQPLWFTVYISEDADAGEYPGHIILNFENAPDTIINVTLHIRDFALPRVLHTRTAFHQGNCNKVTDLHNATTADEMETLIEKYYRYAANHSLNPYLYASAFEPYYSGIIVELVGGPGGPRLEFDLADFDRDAGFFLDELRFNAVPIWPGHGIKTGRLEQFFGYDRYNDTDIFENLTIAFWENISQHLKERGWLDKIFFYIWDEPDGQGEEIIFEKISYYAHLVHQADPEIKIATTCAFRDELEDAIDIWIPPLNRFWNDHAIEQQLAGKEIWWYVACGPRHPYPNYFIDHPGLEPRILYWMAEKFNITGSLYYLTTLWRQPGTDITRNPWIDTTPGVWPNGDGTLLYPPYKEATPSGPFDDSLVPSIRYELIREGLEDYEYFWLLKHAISDVELVRDNYYARILMDAREALRSVDTIVTSRTQYETNPQNILNARAQVAEAIEQLQRIIRLQTMYDLSITPLDIQKFPNHIISATVTNNGRYDIENAEVTFFIGGAPSQGGIRAGPTQVLSVPKQGIASATLTLLPEHYGCSQIYVEVDPINEIVEYNEDNNHAHKVFNKQFNFEI